MLGLFRVCGVSGLRMQDSFRVYGLGSRLVKRAERKLVFGAVRSKGN